jgi:hypothetical protein
MSNRSDTDKAIRNLMNWAERPEWADARAAVFEAHLAPVCGRLGISRDELGQELADHGYGGMLFGAIFEDFVSRRLPDGGNVIDAYLERRAWRESLPGRRYLEQLRDSVLSLYEVVDVTPGRHCDLRDLARDGETIRVHERLGTQNLVRWDRLAARVVVINGAHHFTGGILPFPQEAAQSLMRDLTESRKQFSKAFSQVLGEDKPADIKPASGLGELFLRESCTAFTTIWLMHTLERLRAPLPELRNRDGETLAFAETRFPFLAEQREAIAARLDATPDWVRDDPDEYLWTWSPKAPAAKRKPQRGMAIESLQDGQRPISGTLELKPGALTLQTNSVERMERGRQALETLLHGLVGPALSRIQTPEQAMAERDATDSGSSNKAATDAIDPEIAAGFIHEMLDQHYRRCLDEPVPMLGNKTPRQCARSKKGREKVIEWLKYLENSELRRAASEGQEPYDSRWMWEELKLTQYRS